MVGKRVSARNLALVVQMLDVNRPLDGDGDPDADDSEIHQTRLLHRFSAIRLPSRCCWRLALIHCL